VLIHLAVQRVSGPDGQKPTAPWPSPRRGPCVLAGYRSRALFTPDPAPHSRGAGPGSTGGRVRTSDLGPSDLGQRHGTARARRATIRRPLAFDFMGRSCHGAGPLRSGPPAGAEDHPDADDDIV